MATKKATSTDDLTGSAESASPTYDDLVAGIEENTASDAVAKVDTVKTVNVTSPTGAVTEVPQGIVDTLTDSGYSKTK